MTTFSYESQNGVIVIISDITEGIKLRMHEENKSFKNSLFSSFTHEFRTPLNALFLMSKTLLIQDTLSDEIKLGFIKPIYYNAEILFNLVNAISDYALMTLGKFKLEKSNFKVKEFFHETVEILQFLGKQKKLDVIMEFGPDLPDEIFSDAKRIKQVLFQLYSNALKFTFSGSIRISIEFINKPLEKILVSVADTGIGMTEKALNDLQKAISSHIDYMNYEKITSGSAGASMGLTVSNQIVKKLDYKPSTGIQFKSELNKGSTFSFCIKNKLLSSKVSRLSLFKANLSSKGEERDGSKTSKHYLKLTIDENYRRTEQKIRHSSLDNEIQLKIQRETSTPIPLGQNILNSSHFSGETNQIYFVPSDDRLIVNPPKITLNHKSRFCSNNTQESNNCVHAPVLIVDDDEFNIMALSLLLKSKKIESLAARNGKIAIELIEQECNERKGCCEGFKLIFMDLNMPIMNGNEAIKTLNKNFNDGILPKMPIIVCTAYGDNQKIEGEIEEFTTKPLKVEIVNKLIKKWIDKDELL